MWDNVRKLSTFTTAPFLSLAQSNQQVNQWQRKATVHSSCCYHVSFLQLNSYCSLYSWLWLSCSSRTLKLKLWDSVIIVPNAISTFSHCDLFKYLLAIVFLLLSASWYTYVYLVTCTKGTKIIRHKMSPENLHNFQATWGRGWDTLYCQKCYQIN